MDHAFLCLPFLESKQSTKFTYLLTSPRPVLQLQKTFFPIAKKIAKEIPVSPFWLWVSVNQEWTIHEGRNHTCLVQPHFSTQSSAQHRDDIREIFTGWRMWISKIIPSKCLWFSGLNVSWFRIWIAITFYHGSPTINANRAIREPGRKRNSWISRMQAQMLSSSGPGKGHASFPVDWPQPNLASPHTESHQPPLVILLVNTCALRLLQPSPCFPIWRLVLLLVAACFK